MPPGAGSPAGTNAAGTDPNGTANAARGGNPPTPGTNALGTANSSGSAGGGQTSGQAGAGGTSLTGPSSTGDVAVDEQNRAADKKIKSICKGC